MLLVLIAHSLSRRGPLVMRGVVPRPRITEPEIKAIVDKLAEIAGVQRDAHPPIKRRSSGSRRAVGQPDYWCLPCWGVERRHARRGLTAGMRETKGRAHNRSRSAVWRMGGDRAEAARGGGYGEVWRAEAANGRTGAMKVLYARRGREGMYRLARLVRPGESGGFCTWDAPWPSEETDRPGS